jgi:hypothetical protein
MNQAAADAPVTSPAEPRPPKTTSVPDQPATPHPSEPIPHPNPAPAGAPSSAQQAPPAGPPDVVSPVEPPAHPPASTPAATVDVVKFASVALLLGFAVFGWTVHHRRVRRRPRRLTKWKVVQRADPGRQSVAFLEDPAGPVLGLRIVQAHRAVELSWAKKEASDA